MGLWVVTPEGWGSLHFRLKSLSRVRLQASNASTWKAVTGSGIQGNPQLVSHSEANLSSYHGNFIDGGKWVVENPKHYPIKSKHSFQVQGESQKTGLTQWGENTFVCCAEGCQWSCLPFLLLSEDPGSAEVETR